MWLAGELFIRPESCAEYILALLIPFCIIKTGCLYFIPFTHLYKYVYHQPCYEPLNHFHAGCCAVLQRGEGKNICGQNYLNLITLRAACLRTH
jgi:hypothetical protein